MPRDAVHYIKEAQRARRQGRADEERAQLTAVLEAAVDASMASEKLAATAHLAVLDGDHEAALTATGELIKIDPAHAYNHERWCKSTAFATNTVLRPTTCRGV